MQVYLAPLGVRQPHRPFPFRRSLVKFAKRVWFPWVRFGLVRFISGWFGLTDPIKVIEAHGADALRLYLINSPVVRAESLKFKEEGVQATVREVLLPWFNAFRFFVQQVGCCCGCACVVVSLCRRDRQTSRSWLQLTVRRWRCFVGRGGRLFSSTPLTFRANLFIRVSPQD